MGVFHWVTGTLCTVSETGHVLRVSVVKQLDMGFGVDDLKIAPGRAAGWSSGVLGLPRIEVEVDGGMCSISFRYWCLRGDAILSGGFLNGASFSRGILSGFLLVYFYVVLLSFDHPVYSPRCYYVIRSLIGDEEYLQLRSMFSAYHRCPSDYLTLVYIHCIRTVHRNPSPFGRHSSNRSTSREVLCDGFLCFPCFPWVCGAERVEGTVDGNGYELRIWRCFRKEDRQKSQGDSVCVPQVIVRRVLRPVAEEAEGNLDAVLVVAGTLRVIAPPRGAEKSVAQSAMPA